jgi:hypothetical protein
MVSSLTVQEAGLSQEEIRSRAHAILIEVKRRSLVPAFHWRLSLRWVAAAMIIILVGAGTFWVWQSGKRGAPRMIAPVSSVAHPSDLPPLTGGLVEEANTSRGEKIVRLEDGSTVSLSSGAVIRYTHTDRDSVLEVYLTGDALFKVARHPNRVFRVYSNELVTNVLGTSFRVSAGRNAKDIRVTVLSGKVSVSSRAHGDSALVLPNNLNGVVLTPNQELIYTRTPQVFRKVLIDTPVVVGPSQVIPDFHYDNVPVTEVLEELKKAFGIDIIYDKEALKHCMISADLSDESIYKKLDLICGAMDAHYEVIDGIVTIQGKDCQ